MRKTTFIILFTTMTIFGFSQEDENWAFYHPDFFSEQHYCGRGIGGQTSTQMLARFTADVVNLHPKAVVIMAGTNDVAHNTYWVEPDKVVENVVAMCQLARTNDIVPLISSIPPCASFAWNPDIEDAAQTIVNINERLREYADAHNIVYVDYHSALADEHGGFPAKLSADGSHPNPDTYFIMEELVLKAIGEALR